MTQAPRVVIGLPLCNHADTVREALESLLTQRFRDVRFVAVDDASSDSTGRIVAEYLAHDDRLSLQHNPTRLGMIGNWRRCFELAAERHPEACYFAWGSDHDIWHPRWLGRLVEELDASPEAVMAYPRHRHIEGVGADEVDPRAIFDTAAERSRWRRLRHTILGMSPGNMVYGLFRIEALRRAGIFRTSLLPDRLLLAELSLDGQFRQVPEVLWHRRHEDVFSLRRQRHSLFGGRAPWWARGPWWLTHALILGHQLAIRGSGRPDVGRAAGIRVALQYGVLSAGLHLARGARRMQRRQASDAAVGS